MRPEQYHWDEMKIVRARRRSKRPGMAFHLSRRFRDHGRIVYRLGVALHDLLDPANIIGVGLVDLAAGRPLEVTGTCTT